MKKLFVILSLLIFVFSSVDATPYTDTVSNNIGLTLKDVDKLVMEVHDNDGHSGNIGEVIDKVSLSATSTTLTTVKAFLFKIEVTSSHRILLKLSTVGALKLENGSETIDYSLIHCGTFNDDYEASDASCCLLDNFSGVFGTDLNGVDCGYDVVEYCKMGTEGYLNINDPIWGWFYISVNKSDINGKTAGKYITYIYLTAETTS